MTAPLERSMDGESLNGESLDSASLGGESLDGDRLTELLMRLFLDGDLRARLADEGAAAVAASAGELECLETVDLGELDLAARRFRSKIWKLGRGGSLAAAFPRSLQIFAAAGIGDAELLTGFLGSRRFAGFRLIPHAGIGRSAEESFALFLLDLAGAEGDPPDTRVLRDTIGHELMLALFTALTCEQPLSFVIDAEGIEETGRGHAALRRYAPAAVASWAQDPADSGDSGDGKAIGAVVPYAYFGTPAGVACGAVSERVAAAFETAPTPERDAARRALARRGLW